MARTERYVVGLDVGTSQIAAIVGEAMEDGSLDIVGVGKTDAKGIRRGVVVDLEAAVDSIKGAIKEAELMAGVDIDSVHLGLSGGQADAFNSRGVVAVAGKSRVITRADVDRAIAAAQAVPLDPGREILHVLPQEFVVDDQDGIAGPHRNDRRQSRGERAHRDRQRDGLAEHRGVCQPGRRGRGRHDAGAARGRGVGAHPGREGPRRAARGHRRGHYRFRRLRARQPVAHRLRPPSVGTTSPTTSRSACGRRRRPPR